MRVIITSHLDTLEQNIVQELDDTEDKIKSKIDKLLRQISRNAKTVDGLQSDIIAVKEYASDLHTFLGSKSIEGEVKKEEECLNTLAEDEHLQQLSLRYNINTKIKDILSTITTFGSVSIERSPPGVVMQKMKDKQAQLMSAIQHPSGKSINVIKITLHTTFNIPNGNYDTCITGCIVCSNGRMIFVDHYNRRLVILKDHDTLDKVIICSLGKPFDVTCLDDTSVAVSTGSAIEILNINSTKVERRIKIIKISKPCHGITHHNGVLLWCEDERDIQMMKLSDDRVTTLVKQGNLPCYSYIAHRVSSTVTCYTIKGETLWEYKDVSVLNDPWGVTVDTKSNVYVSSYNISTVAVVKPNGRQGRQLISGDDGLYDPTGIYFDKSKNSLLVTNCCGSPFLYHMC
jgi:hypothetical protein